MNCSKEWSQSEGQTRSAGDAEESEEEIQSLGVSETRSISFSADSDGPARSGDGLDQHRDMMLASLLEDYYRTRAAEFLNSTNPGKNYTRQSREVQPLARNLFAQASSTLASNGLLSSAAVADGNRKTRVRYLVGLDNLGAGTQAPTASLLGPMRDLSISPSDLALALRAHPANHLQLALQPPRPRSHYHSSFQEGRLLGKGGFGRVYMCVNSLDQKTYAVKKIPISAKLGKCFREGRHGDGQHILREVQALARLDHCNVVRYHATWFEEPQQNTSDFGGHGKSLLLIGI
jgi:eukaryotic translation initiation factor 2-alpha kinase 3